MIYQSQPQIVTPVATPAPAPVTAPSYCPPLNQYSPPERAIKHVFDYRTKQWATSEINVCLHPTSFQEGTLRAIYHMRDLSLSGTEQFVVAKVSKDPNEPKTSYFMDVEMQGVAKAYADQFNSRKPPKNISYVMPWVVEFKTRSGRNGKGRLYMGVEHYLPGKYQKHSNNYGFVAPEDRNTPAAFSHFTFASSNGSMMVVDIQGVGDDYTDPQIHTAEKAHRWGKADMGSEGIKQFFRTHKCNAICEFLNLPAPGMKKRIGLATALGPVGAEVARQTSQTAAMAAQQQQHSVASMGSQPAILTSKPHTTSSPAIIPGLTSHAMPSRIVIR